MGKILIVNPIAIRTNEKLKLIYADTDKSAGQK
jgi:hypothetical protein